MLHIPTQPCGAPEVVLVLLDELLLLLVVLPPRPVVDPDDVETLLFPVPVDVLPPVPPATSELLPDAQATPATADR